MDAYNNKDDNDGGHTDSEDKGDGYTSDDDIKGAKYSRNCLNASGSSGYF